MPDRATATRRFSIGRNVRVLAMVLAGALSLSTLVGCTAASTQPILPGTRVINLLPTKAALDKLFGPQWQQASVPRSLEKSELAIATKVDPSRVGSTCSKALNDWYATYLPRDGATVEYEDTNSSTAQLFIYRLATVAKAGAFIKMFGAIGYACKDAPGDAGVRTQPLKSSIPGAVGYGAHDASSVNRYVAIADGDLVIMVSSNISTAQIDNEVRLEIDTIKRLANAG